MEERRRLALFDCDGTLVDSQANICTAMERAFADVGLPEPTRAATRRIVGLSVLEAMRMMAPEGDAALHTALADRYREAFFELRRTGAIEEPLFDGIADTLVQLREDGWLLGVATGKSDRGLGLCLATHGLESLFVTLQTADRHPSKPHPSMVEAAMVEAGVRPADTVVIGDTGWDIGMAVAAGVAGIGVAWGYHDPVDLLEAGAAAVASHARELPVLLENNLGRI